MGSLGSQDGMTCPSGWLALTICDLLRRPHLVQHALWHTAAQWLLANSHTYPHTHSLLPHVSLHTSEHEDFEVSFLAFLSGKAGPK